ncbi:MAG: FtsW/RodA/SpoVE family cell cycle protein [Bacteroidales bacterium]|nr:FtsW/RodA/SpoVE family cell cycle protein [Bacteroidales bacterium]
MRNFLQAFKGDRVIWVLMVFLTVYSGIAVASSVAALAFKDGGNASMHIVRHVGFLAVGWMIIYFVHKIPYKHYSTFANLLLVISVVLLVYTLLFGVHLNEATRSVRIPGTGITFQSSDFAKIALIIFVARFLSRNQTEIQDFKKGFLPVVGVIGGVCVLILPENFSTAAILFVTCMVLLFVGRTKIKYLLSLAGAGVVLVLVVIMLGKATGATVRDQTWQKRMEQHFSKDANQEEVFQSDKAKIAIANGGMFGKFAGHSTQRRSLPQAYSDFIYAIVIEEYGFLFGALPLVFIYLILMYRAGVIVRKCDRSFPAFLVIGLVTGLVIQAMVNMGVSSGLLPVTGQPLPWVSRGGTSILFTALSIGIILGISRAVNEEAEGEKE